MSKIKPKECQNVEFKTSWNDKYLEWICGFANAQGAVGFRGVRVTFQRKGATENATENSTVKINKTQQKMLAIIHEDKYATYDVIAKQLGVERTTVWRNIKSLQKKGLLCRVGGDKGGYWEVIDD